ncbi:hypothetical protein FHS85_004345 [Rhodoligotrophos appendicifer]|uniref:hypothetical protein n=1 Tax=Rhodoligotrophos appendicifer TaxID=987056 RepID=UPI001186DFAE|nr:hypothetical protein [Rhodoligotrophos appendicifer]
MAHAFQSTDVGQVSRNSPGIFFDHNLSGRGAGSENLSYTRIISPELGDGGAPRFTNFHTQDTGVSTNPFVNADGGHGVGIPAGFTGATSQDRNVFVNVTEQIEIPRSSPTPVETVVAPVLHDAATQTHLDVATQTNALPGKVDTAVQTEAGWSTSAKVAAAVGGIGAGVLLVGAAAVDDSADKDVEHHAAPLDSHSIL